MSRILAIAWKDLRSTMRNVPALAMMLVAPLALAALLGFAFGGGQSFSISATKVAVANADTGTAGVAENAGNVVVGVMKSPDLRDIITVGDKPSAAAARTSVDDGKSTTAVIIPADLSAAIFATSPTAPMAVVELYENPTQEIGGAITESIVGQALLGFNGARAAALAASGLATANGDGERAGKLAQQAAETYMRDGGAAAAVSVAQRAPRLPGGESTKDVGVTGTILAGMMIFFMFFGANNVARTIIDEDRAGTLPRLFTTPTSRHTILGGKYSSVFVTVTVQAVILLVAGRLIFSIDWGRLDAVAALTLVAAAVASGLALLVISLVRTPAQAGAIGAGVYLVLALVGGNFTGTAAAGGTYAQIQKLTPNGWLLQGWDAVMRGGGLADIGLNLLVPLLFAVAFFAVAALRFRKRYA
ncbi:MAG: ABC transporter permease [Actinobacteria bacterium]|nr:ABC transporter permease [Actinomycetota bacterium]